MQPLQSTCLFLLHKNHLYKISVHRNLLILFSASPTPFILFQYFSKRQQLVTYKRMVTGLKYFIPVYVFSIKKTRHSFAMRKHLNKLSHNYTIVIIQSKRILAKLIFSLVYLNLSVFILSYRYKFTQNSV